MSYNRLDLLKICINSFESLYFFQDLKITILDNASDFDVFDEFGHLINSNFKILRNEYNIGSVGNFIKAVDNSSSEFIMIFHDDDCISPSLIPTQLSLFQSYLNCGFIVTGVNLVDNIDFLGDFHSKSELVDFDYYSNFGDILDLYFSKNILGFGSIMYRTDLLKGYFENFDDYGNVGDRALMLNLSMQSSFIHLKSPTYNAFQHNSQESYIRGWSFDLDIKLINLYINSSLISKKYYLFNTIYIWSSQLYSMRKPLPSLIKSVNDIQFNNFIGKIIFILFIPFYYLRSRLVNLIKLDYPNLYKFVIKIKKFTS
jgi:hypothetical protein